METNNKAMRDALKLCVDEMCNRCRDLASARGNPLPCLNGCEPVRKAKAALAEPVRNYEVGTVEEQTDRWNNENPYPYEWDDTQYLDTKEVLKWAQMPYEEGGAE